MGSPVAPSIANLFMIHFGKRFILDRKSNPFYEKIVFFRHYIDDIFCILSDSNYVTPSFEWVNSLYESMKFECWLHSGAIAFFDTIVTKDSYNRLQLKTFVKPTDKNSYLHFSSHHTAQLCNNIPYGQFLWLRQNSCSVLDFCWGSQRLSKQFQDRGCPADVISKTRGNVLRIDHKSLFQNKPSQQEDRIQCSFEFNQHNYAISKLIKRHWHIINHLPQCAVAPLVKFKKTRSIRDLDGTYFVQLTMWNAMATLNVSAAKHVSFIYN